ncbi:MAG: polyprenyl synthetase family protein [Candidatus Neomarinimicrobiota bacterium]|nr:polyprenyl synthetase family protein [Candidatus Neomarinimicrobiota bacterium]
MSSDNFSEKITGYRLRINEALLQIGKDAEPAYLYDPIRYVFSGKGKRIRPVLVLLTASGFGAGEDETLPAALAVEILHNFSLVHDDIMDGDDLRHGKQAVHHRWDNPTAILAGDGIFALAYDQLNHLNSASDACLKVFTNAALRLCEGQALDKAFEAIDEVSVDNYLEMVRLKTGTLLSLCCQIGAILGEADDKEKAAVAYFGERVGQAFQIQDDILEIYSNSKNMGKSLGSDLVAGKKTFLTCKAEELNSSDWRTFMKSLDGEPLSERIPKMRDYFDVIGIVAEGETLVSHLSEEAVSTLEPLPGSVKNNLVSFIELLTEREN